MPERFLSAGSDILSAYRQLYRNYLDASREKNLTISMIGMMLTAMSMARP